jgi:hypothetical protein
VDLDQALAGERSGAFGGDLVALATPNMLGDMISSPAQRCVTISRTIFVPATFQPPPILVSPPPFTVSSFTATPPPFTVTPPPLVLSNGHIIPVPSFSVSPPPVNVPLSAPLTITPAPFTVTPPPVVVPGFTPVVVQEMQCAQVLAAASRASSFKISEDESPLPQDRLYFGFNYFNNVNAAVNERMGGFVSDMTAYRDTFGFEKTFLDTRASVELRLPVGTLTMNSDVAGLGGTDTNVGDLSIGLKYALYLDRAARNDLSAGLVITVPTGPAEFNPFGTTIIQPWVGGLVTAGNVFVQGFISLAVPTDSRDVTLLFNDIAIGYIFYRSRDPQSWLQAVAPTYEVHVNTPLNHRGAFNFDDPVATPDWVSMTFGTTFALFRSSTLAIGGNVPVTGPKPYDFEILAQLNYRF